MHAIILRMHRLKECDAIIDWLVDDDCLVTTYAAHLHGTSAYPNGLEWMNVYEVEIERRPNQDMGRIRSALSVERFDHIVEDLGAYACAGAALEMISNVCPREATIVDLFSTLLSVLAVMNTAPDLSTTMLSWFECFVLHQVGAMPNLEICAQCAQPLQKSEWFQQELGFLCPKCAKHQSNIPAFVLESLRKLRYQSVRTTVQNALSRKSSEEQRRKILTPVLQLLMAVMCDNSPVHALKAHRCMGEMALGQINFANTLHSRTMAG